MDGDCDLGTTVQGRDAACVIHLSKDLRRELGYLGSKTAKWRGVGIFGGHPGEEVVCSHAL